MSQIRIIDLNIIIKDQIILQTNGTELIFEYIIASIIFPLLCNAVDIGLSPHLALNNFVKRMKKKSELLITLNDL